MLWSCFLFLVFYKVRKCKSDEEQSVDNIPFIRAVKKAKRVGKSELVGCCVQVGIHLVDFELISRGIWRVIQSFSKFKKCFYLIHPVVRGNTAIFLHFREHLLHNFTHIALKTHNTVQAREVILFYHTKLIHVSPLPCISLSSLSVRSSALHWDIEMLELHHTESVVRVLINENLPRRASRHDSLAKESSINVYILPLY